MSESAQDVENAVIQAYSEATGLAQDVVRNGIDSGDEVPFDSVLGVELIVAIESRFGVTIAEDEEGKAKNFKSLRNFGKMVGRYVRSGEARQ